jgi:hypothetical protein
MNTAQKTLLNECLEMLGKHGEHLEQTEADWLKMRHLVDEATHALAQLQNYADASQVIANLRKMVSQ